MCGSEELIKHTPGLLSVVHRHQRRRQARESKGCDPVQACVSAGEATKVRTRKRERAGVEEGRQSSRGKSVEGRGGGGAAGKR